MTQKTQQEKQNKITIPTVLVVKASKQLQKELADLDSSSEDSKDTDADTKEK